MIRCAMRDAKTGGLCYSCIPLLAINVLEIKRKRDHADHDVVIKDAFSGYKQERVFALEPWEIFQKTLRLRDVNACACMCMCILQIIAISRILRYNRGQRLRFYYSKEIMTTVSINAVERWLE